MKIVAYYRVSTQRQGESGLGLDAQRSALEAYATSVGGAIIDEFTEIESGTRSDRPMLRIALDRAIKTHATLVIARLDRLARNVHFVSGLMETKARFVALDMPTADRFMLHVYAAMAEEEARRISARTKAALCAAKARGIRLGANGLLLARQERANAMAFASTLSTAIDNARASGAKTLRELCSALNDGGLRTRGNTLWSPTTIARVLRRLESSRAADAHPSASG